MVKDKAVESGKERRMRNSHFSWAAYLARTISRRSGFTLVELLVVITIIGDLDCAVVAGGAGGARGRPAAAMHQQSQTDWAGRREPRGGAAASIRSAAGDAAWVGDPDRGFEGWKQPGGFFYNILPYMELPALHDMGARGNFRNGGNASVYAARTHDGRRLLHLPHAPQSEAIPHAKLRAVPPTTARGRCPALSSGRRRLCRQRGGSARPPLHWRADLA